MIEHTNGAKVCPAIGLFLLLVFHHAAPVLAKEAPVLPSLTGSAQGTSGTNILPSELKANDEKPPAAGASEQATSVLTAPSNSDHSTQEEKNTPLSGIDQIKSSPSQSLTAAPGVDRVPASSLTTESNTTTPLPNVPSNSEPKIEPPPGLAPTTAPNTTAPVPVAPLEPKAPAPVFFSLHELKIEGNTILSKEKVDFLVAPFLGEQKGFADIEKARAELEKAYHDAGYPTVLVIVPEQTIENQSVRMDVIEGKLDKVELTGNRYYSTNHILKKLPSLKVDQVPYEPDVEKELGAVNLNPDLFVTPVLSPGEEQGKVSLLLNVKDRFPLHGSIEWNNKQSPHTKRYRMEAMLQYTNLFDRDQVVTFNTTQSPDDFGRVQVYGLNYAIPLSDPEHLLMFYVNRSESGSVLPGSSLLDAFQGDITFLGNSTISGVRYQYPLKSGGTWVQQLSWTLEYKQIGPTSADFNGGTANSDPFLQSFGSAFATNPVNYLPATVSYTGSKLDAAGSLTLNLSVKANRSGLVGWGGENYFGGDPPSASASPDWMPGAQAGSTGNFVVLQPGIEIRRVFGKGFELWLKGNGQMTNEPLISSEKFFGGGVDSVRGYLDSEAPGDEGVRGSIELVSPKLPALITGKSKEEMHLSAFLDGARLYIKNTLPGQTDQYDLQGTGIGLNFKLQDNFQASFNQAWALHDSVITPKLGRLFHFSVKALF